MIFLSELFSQELVLGRLSFILKAIFISVSFSIRFRKLRCYVGHLFTVRSCMLHDPQCFCVINSVIVECSLLLLKGICNIVSFLFYAFSSYISFELLVYVLPRTLSQQLVATCGNMLHACTIAGVQKYKHHMVCHSIYLIE